MVCFYIPFVEDAFYPIDIADVFIDPVVAIFKIHIADDEHKAGYAQCQPKDVDEGEEFVFGEMSK